MSEKPTTAFIMSLLGGIFILITGLAWAVVGTFLAFLFGLGFLLYAFLLFGIVVIIGAVMMIINPKSTKTWGVVILILGVCSLPGVITALGGLLAIIGGALALSWKPENMYAARSPAPPPPASATFYCQTCGSPLRYIPEYQRWYCDREGKYV